MDENESSSLLMDLENLENIKSAQDIGNTDKNDSSLIELEKLKDNVSTELTQDVRNVANKDSGLFSISISDSDLANRLSDFTKPPDIDEKLSELQCPFTWPLPREGVIPLAMVAMFTSMPKDIEEGEDFKMSNFIYDILTVYEFCNAGKLDKAYKMLVILMQYLEDLNSSCEEAFFISMKKPLQHIVFSCEAHLLKAYFSDKLPSQAELYSRRVLKVLFSVHPCSEMTEVELAGIYGFKAQAFIEYGYNGFHRALEYAKKALELDPKQAEWYYQTGKLMGSIRRLANWNDYVKEEEIKFLEQAIELREKPSYLIFLAAAYIDCTKTIHRNSRVDEEMSKKLHEMNNRAKQLFMRSIELSPNCPVVSMRCANGMLKMPKHFADKDVVEKCIKLALQKSPDDPMVHHAAGMCAERLEYDIEKALRHYEIASEYVYGALADFIRLKYTYEKEYDLLDALENMLESYLSLPSVHKTLSYIGAYYLFLKRDLIRSLDYYRRIMNEDSNSSAITSSKPLFLNMKTPVNMYQILCTEVHLELQKKDLSDKEINTLQEFLSRLNQIDPDMSKKFADKPSRIQQIVDESIMLTEKYKTIIQKKREQNLIRSGGGSMRGNTRRDSTSRGRGRERGQARTGRRQSDSSIVAFGSWRNIGNLESDRRASVVESNRKSSFVESNRRGSVVEPHGKASAESCRRASVIGSWREKGNEVETTKSKELEESEDSVGTLPLKKQDNVNNSYNAKSFGRPRTYSNEFRRPDKDILNSALNTKDYRRSRTYSNECRKNDQDNFNNSLTVNDYGRVRAYSNEFRKQNENSAQNKQADTESKPVQKFQKNNVVQVVRDPYGPYEGGVQKSFERRRVPDMKWVKQ